MSDHDRFIANAFQFIKLSVAEAMIDSALKNAALDG
jgi:hypothetical protein